MFLNICLYMNLHETLVNYPFACLYVTNVMCYTHFYIHSLPCHSSKQCNAASYSAEKTPFSSFHIISALANYLTAVSVLALFFSPVKLHFKILRCNKVFKMQTLRYPGSWHDLKFSPSHCCGPHRSDKFISIVVTVLSILSCKCHYSFFMLQQCPLTPVPLWGCKSIIEAANSSWCRRFLFHPTTQLHNTSS